MPCLLAWAPAPRGGGGVRNRVVRPHCSDESGSEGEGELESVNSNLERHARQDRITRATAAEATAQQLQNFISSGSEFNHPTVEAV